MIACSVVFTLVGGGYDITTGLTALSAYGVLFLVNVEFVRFVPEFLEKSLGSNASERHYMERLFVFSMFFILVFSLLDIVTIKPLEIITKSELSSDVSSFVAITLALPILLMKWYRILFGIMAILNNNELLKDKTSRVLCFISILGMVSYLPVSFISFSYLRADWLLKFSFLMLLPVAAYIIFLVVKIYWTLVLLVNEFMLIVFLLLWNRGKKFLSKKRGQNVDDNRK